MDDILDWEQHPEQRPEAATVKQAVGIAIAAIRSLPDQDEWLRPRLSKLLAKHRDRTWPGADQPLTWESPWSRLALVVEHEQQRRRPPDEIDAAATAADFPGSVSRSHSRVARTVKVDLSVPGWASTGLYALPGEPVELEVNPEIVEQGLALRIGCHKDVLWQKDKWHRHPEITRRAVLRDKKTTLANAHGGLVYVEVPAGLQGDSQVSIRGCVQAPWFAYGVTTDAEWVSRIRDYPAPWAEIQTQHIILTMPSEHIRDLANPSALAEVWDEILEYYAELSMRPLPRRRERMVCDVQISAGYMHAGYPIMMHLDQGPILPSVERLPGSWGLWHELGHNHQQPDWTFAGTVEVTCNLFTLFVEEKTRGIAPIDHPRMQEQADKLAQYLAGDNKFATWKSKPFLALLMYVQLQDAFGWDLFQQVFAEYAELKEFERPQDDEAKRDQWLIRCSKAAGKNLGPFFEQWGVPVSDSARSKVNHLPAWLPESLGPSDS